MPDKGETTLGEFISRYLKPARKHYPRKGKK